MVLKATRLTKAHRKIHIFHSHIFQTKSDEAFWLFFFNSSLQDKMSSNWVLCSFVVSNREKRSKHLAVKLQKLSPWQTIFLSQIVQKWSVYCRSRVMKGRPVRSKQKNEKSTICVCLPWREVIQMICAHLSCYPMRWREGSENTDE